MAKPEACQTPSAAVAPSSSIPAKAPQLGTPFKAERCPREPGFSCGPWVGPITAPPAAPYTGWRNPLKGWLLAAAPRQGDPVSWGGLEPRDTESRVAEVPWDPGLAPVLHQPLVLFACGVVLAGTDPLAGFSRRCPSPPPRTGEVTCSAGRLCCRVV